MKIARIESFIFGTRSSKDLLFCRVETEDGTYGWGEGYVTAGKENVIACTDCGLRHLPDASLAFAKLYALAEGAKLASQELWG